MILTIRDLLVTASRIFSIAMYEPLTISVQVYLFSDVLPGPRTTITPLKHLIFKADHFLS